MSTTLEQLDEPKSLPRKALRLVAVAAIVLAGVLVIAIGSNPAEKDYISYWSAAKLLIHHADPYSSTQVLALEKAHGFLPDKPLVMRNPPWALFLVLPLCIFTPLAGMLAWTIAGVGCVVWSIRLLNAQRDTVLAFAFAPILGCIALGQSSLFLLLGFSLFLYYQSRRPFVAGASLLLMAVKPHLFLVFWAVLLIDCIIRRSYRVIGGMVFALGLASAFALCVDHLIWSQYFQMLQTARLDHEFIPTISALLRIAANARMEWIQFVPSGLAVLWGCWYYANERSKWDWREQGMVIVLVSVLVSPYAWFPDEAALLPCILFAWYFQNKRRYSAAILVVINTGIILMLFFPVQVTSGAYIWTPIAWLAWFLYATNGFRTFHRSSTNQTAILESGAAIEVSPAP